MTTFAATQDQINKDRGKPVRRGNECLCGCALATNTEQARYLPGHDARHVSKLLRAVFAGEISREAAVEYLPSASLQAKFNKAYTARTIKTEMRAAGATHRSANSMAKQTKTPAVTKSVVKVGRWEYPAETDKQGRLFRNTKRDGSGEWVAA